MKIHPKQEAVIALIIAIPFVYLAVVWNSLPESVPIHWNSQGEIDGWGSKATLLIAPLLPLVTYFIFFISPIIDPKGKIAKSGRNYYRMKLGTVLFMSILGVYIIYSSKAQAIGGTHLILVLVGGLIAVMGNYMQSLKPNYFIGIRTPWTLESEHTWRKTHLLGGKLWVLGGIIICIGGLILPAEMRKALLITIVAILTLVPLVYSFYTFKKEKKYQNP